MTTLKWKRPVRRGSRVAHTSKDGRFVATRTAKGYRLKDSLTGSSEVFLGGSLLRAKIYAEILVDFESSILIHLNGHPRTISAQTLACSIFGDAEPRYIENVHKALLALVAAGKAKRMMTGFKRTLS